MAIMIAQKALLFTCHCSLIACLHNPTAGFACMQGFVDRLAGIAGMCGPGAERETFLAAFDKAALEEQRMVFVGHSLGYEHAIQP